MGPRHQDAPRVRHSAPERNAEREEGTTWTQLGAAAGISRQAAHERWSPTLASWTAGPRTALGGSSGLTALDAAYGRLDPENQATAFSSGLDAVRSPGAEADRSRRARAAALHARLTELDDEHRELQIAFQRLATVFERADLLTRQAALEEERAAAHAELAETELKIYCR
ncbi:hypothetical protein ABZY09_44910 [Streptomyces sp. NPDC002928]|uniref:hypothetical protein n=1 Tax=Streptomyces sp. NPDC002928 TaxID=3154440 RepID=UPI0033BF4C49